MASEWSRAARWAGRIGLFVALGAAAVGGDAVSAQPPAVPERGLPAPAALAVSERVPVRTLGIAAQDNWLGD
ncbi:MAG: hypothetical protein ABW221_21255 [Vicinamibacteria bacterium]